MNVRRAPTFLAVVALAACRPSGPSPEESTARADAKPAVQIPGRLDEDYTYLLGAGEEADPEGVIVRHMESDAHTLNPVVYTQTYEFYVLRYLFDALYEYDKDLKSVPQLAEAMPEIDATGLEWTVRLRKGVKFHDGTEMTAKDVAFTMGMILNPEVPALLLRSNYELLDRLEVVDPYTVKFLWKVPYAAAQSAINSIRPMPEHLYKTDKLAEFGQRDIDRKPVGTGAWRFVDWKPGQSLTVEPNPNYWGEKARAKKTVFRVIENRSVALKACQAGELDEQRVDTEPWFTETTTPEFLKDFNRAAFYQISYSYVLFNCRNPLLSDARVRRALTMLDNRDAYVRDLYRGFARTISGPFSEDTEWADPSVKPLPYDPTAAVALLAEAGWVDTDKDGTLDKDGKKFAIEVAYPAGNTISEQMGALFQESVARVGVEINMRAFEGAAFFDKISRGEFEAGSLAWNLDPDPDWVYAIFHTSQAPPVGSNQGFFSDPELDKLLEAQRSELDHAKRVALMHQIHVRLRDQAPYLFRVQVPERRVVRKHIRGFGVSPVGPFQITPGAEHWFVTRARSAM